MPIYNGSSLPIYRTMEEQSSEYVPKGVWDYDKEVLTPYQHECSYRFSLANQIEHEHYLQRHPEIAGMLKLLFAERINHRSLDKDVLKHTALNLVRPVEEIDADLRKLLQLSPDRPYSECTENYEDPALSEDFSRIKKKLKENRNKKNKSEKALKVFSSQSSTPTTLSSSFLSILTSTITLPTPELIPTPELTSSQVFHNMISMQIDKAIYSRLNDANIRYDIAYVELIKAVEAAMEIPVIAICEDIASLLNGAYLAFLSILDAKAKIAAEIAWQNRMKKKLKRTLRMHNNFRGYEASPAFKSEPSSHENFKQASQQSPKDYPQSSYNRYPKDRFGIYLPRATEYSDKNITLFGCLQEDDIIVQTDATSIKSASP